MNEHSYLVLMMMMMMMFSGPECRSLRIDAHTPAEGHARLTHFSSSCLWILLWKSDL